MAFDSMRGVTVLFGGYDFENEIHLSDTWEWNGTSWTQRNLNGAHPENRQQGGMAYDPALGVTVLMGGMRNYNDIHYSDIWHWNGSDWVDQGDILQGGGDTGTAAYDSIRGRTWLHTGRFAGYCDTEGWNGTDTFLLVFHPYFSPADVSGTAMAYDSARGVCVLFGTACSAETWEFGSDLRITQQPLDQVVAPGESLTLTVTTTGTGPIYYAWHKDGETLVDDGRISGSTTGTLTIDPVEPGDAGSYHVVVRSDCGPIGSDAATVITCIGDINGDGSIGQPDLGILLANYDSTDATYQEGDLDLDGDVDQADLGILLATYEIPCP